MACAVQTTLSTGEVVLSLTPDAPQACQGYILITPAEYLTLTTADVGSVLTQGNVVQSFGFGFMAVVSVWAVAWVIKVGKQLIRIT